MPAIVPPVPEHEGVFRVQSVCWACLTKRMSGNLALAENFQRRHGGIVAPDSAHSATANRAGAG